MDQRTVGLALAIYIVLSLLIVGIWDLYATLWVRDNAITVSAYLRQWAHDFPIGVLSIGVLIGHLVWPGGSNPSQPGQ